MKNERFVIIVAGENPEEMMRPYDINGDNDTEVLYYKVKSKEIWGEAILKLETIINDGLCEKFGYDEETLNAYLLDIKEMGYEAYFDEISEPYEKDEYGNALYDENPNGKWEIYSYPNLFAVPFVLKNGEETFQAKVCDIDWSKMHLHNEEPYIVAWETVVEGIEPMTDDERNIYENMKNRTQYFENFENKEAYVNYNTAFWSYAFLDEKGWEEINNRTKDQKWVSEYFERFILPLIENEPNTLLTIFECTR